MSKSKSPKTSFIVDLGDVSLSAGAAEKLQSRIEAAVLEGISTLDLGRNIFRVGPLGPGTIGLIVERAGDFRELPEAGPRSSRSVFRVELGDVQLTEEQHAGIARSVTAAAVSSLAKVDQRFGKSVAFGRLGPELIGYMIRNDWKQIQAGLKQLGGG